MSPHSPSFLSQMQMYHVLTPTLLPCNSLYLKNQFSYYLTNSFTSHLTQTIYVLEHHTLPKQNKIIMLSLHSLILGRVDAQSKKCVRGTLCLFTEPIAMALLTSSLSSCPISSKGMCWVNNPVWRLLRINQCYFGSTSVCLGVKPSCQDHGDK